MKSVLNHVAILVESIESVVEKNLFDSNYLGDIEEFPSEGTRELYIGPNNQMGKLLLMQAIGTGPYQNAFNKRGAGLHHIAIDVLSIDEFIRSLSNSGWLLHSKSLEFYKSIKQVWLSRPGNQVLIEVNETKEFVDSEYFIEELEFPFIETRLVEALCCERLKRSDKIQIHVDGKEITVNELLEFVAGTSLHK